MALQSGTEVGGAMFWHRKSLLTKQMIEVIISVLVGMATRGGGLAGKTLDSCASLKRKGTRRAEKHTLCISMRVSKVDV